MGLKGKKKDRQEKTKVKLKVKKTLLPKGQNVTNTSFKVKKIVIREQLKAYNVDEPLTRRKLNVKELLTRLQHHNTTVRQDGLDGLKELTTVFPPEVFSPHLASLIEGITALILDRESAIRRDALKLLKSMLTQVSSTQIAPFFDIMQSYLGCAMTHIHSITQEDSLLLLDILLETTPNLCAQNSHKIMPNFLDMISKLRSEAQPGRTLTINLGSKLTSVKWRIKVLTRLHGLLAALVQNESVDQASGELSQVFQWNSDTTLSIPLYYEAYLKNNELPILFGQTAKGLETTGTELKAYNNVLMPLLFETWLEIAPSIDNNQEDKSVNVISAEAAELLKCILDIVQLSWEYLQSKEQESKFLTLTEWFKAEYEKDIRKYLLRGFPYCSTEMVAAKGKKRKRHQEYTEDLEATKNCVQQNISLCHVLCCIHDDAEFVLCSQILDYITKCVLSWHELEATAMQELVKVVRIILAKHSKKWMSRQIKVEKLLNAVVKCFHRTNKHFQAFIFEILADLVLDPTFAHLLECHGFDFWRTQLPQVLCQPEVSVKTIKMLSRLACQNNRPFLDSLTKSLPSVLGNLNTLKVIGANSNEEGKQSVANLLFWISNSKNFTKILSEASKNWNQPLVDYVNQVILVQ